MLDNILDKVRALFKLFGFVPIDTPIVERLEILAAKGGDVDKEIYALGRAKANDSEAAEAELGLRFDLTVPLARYVAQHFNELSFPFKRYHIGSCFRGERPQDGRYRQFTQADIDIINIDRVPLSFDADIPQVVNEAIQLLGLKNYVFRISNRKILVGFLTGLRVENIQEVTRIIDKLDKIGRETVMKLLVDQAKVSSIIAESVLRLASVATSDIGFVDQVRQLGVQNELLEAGLQELEYVMRRVTSAGSREFSADLSITRGLDYYTGSVYEVRWNDHPGIGSIAAGGRYDDLASNYIRKKLPGVGMSVGISRIFGKLAQLGALDLSRKTSTDVLLIWEEQIEESQLQQIATSLRNRAINVEVYYAQEKVARQITYADRKGIPFVVFTRTSEIKNLVTGIQEPFDAQTFTGKAKNN
jgi:histidyl-tRNA synthetase